MLVRMTDLPVLVLLHGALGSGAGFADVVRELSPFARVLAPDLPGHGGMPLPARFATDGFVDAVTDVLDREGVERAHVFGYSMGGHVALALALRSPERVAGVMTLATKLRWTPDVAARESRLLDLARMREKVPRFAGELEARHAPTPLADLLSRTADFLRELGDSPELTPEVLSALAVPALFAVGDRDATVTLDETAGAARAVEGAGLLVLPDVPHPLERVPTSRLTFELRGFLART